MMASIILRNSLSLRISEVLEGHGWADRTIDPHGLFYLILKVVPRLSGKTCYSMIQELIKVNAAKFSTLADFMSRFHISVRKRMERPFCPHPRGAQVVPELPATNRLVGQCCLGNFV